MAASSLDLGAYGIVPEDWPDADSCKDLASVYKELSRIDALDQVVIRHLPSLESEGQVEATTSSQDSSSVPENIWRKAAQRIDRQREALRSRATFLSRGETRGVRLTDLSAELLILIINNFRHSFSLDNTTGGGFVTPFPESDLQVVQSLRLVSRLFNDLASPLVYPIIRLSIDQKSLDRVRHISSNPFLASGVWGIRIGLEYRPMVLARSFDKWLAHHDAGISNRLLSSEVAQNAFRLKKAKDSGDEKRAKKLIEEKENLRQALSRLKLVRFAISQWMGNNDKRPDEMDEERVSRYMELIRKCHEEYSQAYEEQARLMVERSFVGAVARLAVQASRPIALELFEREFRIPKKAANESRTVFRSKSALSSYLTSPVRWSQEQFAEDDEKEHLAVSIISDLPIAIHQGGGVVSALQLGCPPLAHQLDAMTDPEKGDWEGIKAAFGHLKVLRIPPLFVDSREGLPSLAEKQRFIFETYFSSLLSSQHLEEVFLDGIPYLGIYRFNSPGAIWSLLGKLLGNVSWPQIKMLKISCVSLTQAQMESLFQGLGTGLNEIVLDRVRLVSGSWIGAIDILREKVGQTHAPESLVERRSAHFNAIGGGDIVDYELDRDIILRAVEAYVTGESSSKNPVLEYAEA